MNELSTETFVDNDAPPRMDLMMMDPDKMSALVRFSEMMSQSVVSLPKHFHGKPADCLAVCLQAAEWRMNPFAVAQKTHVVNGALGYEAQLVNAVLRATGAVSSRANYEYRGSGQTLECRVGYVVAGESAVTWNEWYAISDVKVKNSPLWGSNPKQQLGYLQVKNWARQYAPGAILGIRTPDELQDIADAAPAPKGPRRKSESSTPMVERVDSDGVISGADAPALTSSTPPAAAPTASTKAAAAPAPAPATAAGAQGGISGNQVAYLRNKLKSTGVAEQSICDRFQVTSIELLNAEQFDEVKSELLQMA